MKSLKQQIQEKYLIDKDTNPDEDLPVIGEIAYDYIGDPWEILDFCTITKNNKELKALIKTYDYSGNFNDFIKEISNLYDENDLPEFAVAAKNENGDVGLWVWGLDGICYGNK